MRGPVKILDHPKAYPGHTVWGKTGGPVAFVGYVEQPTDRHPGIAVFLDERESRQLALAWGWPTPEAYAELRAEADDLAHEVERLTAELAVARENQIEVVPVRELAGVLGKLRSGDDEPVAA